MREPPEDPREGRGERAWSSMQEGDVFQDDAAVLATPEDVTGQRGLLLRVGVLEFGRVAKAPGVSLHVGR